MLLSGREKLLCHNGFWLQSKDFSLCSVNINLTLSPDLTLAVMQQPALCLVSQHQIHCFAFACMLNLFNKLNNNYITSVALFWDSVIIFPQTSRENLVPGLSFSVFSSIFICGCLCFPSFLLLSLFLDWIVGTVCMNVRRWGFVSSGLSLWHLSVCIQSLSSRKGQLVTGPRLIVSLVLLGRDFRWSLSAMTPRAIILYHLFLRDILILDVTKLPESVGIVR